MRKILIFFSYFFIFPAIAGDFISTTITDGCNINVLGFTENVEMVPMFEPKQITCTDGFYLPINTAHCETCPSEAICIPGTYAFNENKSQGVIFNDAIGQDKTKGCVSNILGVHNDVFLEAVFAPRQIICPLGYYLLANNVECTRCPNDSYCVGGTYSFSKTVDQGLTPCPDQHPFAPTGMWLESQCGRKLHIGDNVLYVHQSPANPTEHRLYVRYGDTKYSANLYQISYGENIQKMSVDATRSLRIKINDIEYVVYDDSIK